MFDHTLWRAGLPLISQVSAYPCWRELASTSTLMMSLLLLHVLWHICDVTFPTTRCRDYFHYYFSGFELHLRRRPGCVMGYFSGLWVYLPLEHMVVTLRTARGPGGWRLAAGGWRLAAGEDRSGTNAATVGRYGLPSPPAPASESTYRGLSGRLFGGG